MWCMWNFRRYVIEFFNKKGDDVYLIAPLDNIYTKKFQEMGCHVYDIPLETRGINPISEIRLLYRYVHLLREIHPDINFSFSIKPNIYLSMASCILRYKYIPIVTGLGYSFENRGFVCNIVKCLYKIAFKNATEVWFLNKDNKALFIKEKLIIESITKLLPGEGVNLERFHLSPIYPYSLKFLFIGRLLRDKGVNEFVEAARLVKLKYPLVEFCLLGGMWDDYPGAITKKELDSWEKEGIVHYLGETSDVRSYIEKSSCIVLPSYGEGLPFSLLEGAAMGRPLIASDVSGCRDIVVDGYNGFLCKNKNYVDLANKIERFILLPVEMRKDFGKNSRLLVESKFDVEIVIEHYNETISRVCKQ